MLRHVPVYRPILKQALATAWTHRELWPIAAVAGLAGTGAVLNDLLNEAKFAVSVPAGSFSEACRNLPLLQVYKEQIMLASPGQITLGTLIVAAVIVLVLLAITACQQIILRVIHRAASKKAPVTWTELRHELLHPRLFRFLGLDLFLKLIVINLMIATTMLLSYLSVSTVISDAFFGLVFAVLVFCLALGLNIVVMLALIGVAKKDLGMGAALLYGWQLFRKHTWICLEMAALLFAANFLISAIYNGTILVLGIPAAYTFLAALETGSFALYLGLMALITLVVAAVTLGFAGFATTFTYAAWIGLAEHLDKKVVTSRIVVHTKRFFQTFK